MIEYIILILAVVAAIWVALTYNSFISLKTQMKNAWAQIDVQMKRRFDLVPNLVETVKGYTKHERGTLNEVTKARAAIASAGKDPGKRMAAENMLTGALKSLFAVSEAYPDLKANQNFLMLQEELAGIENKIAYARQFYNDAVMKWNRRVQMFPSNIIAGMFKFNGEEHLQIETEAKGPVKVKF